MEVCLVDYIIPGPYDDANWGDLFFIDPEVCIDCGTDISVCPPEAIFSAEDVPSR